MGGDCLFAGRLKVAMADSSHTVESLADAVGVERKTIVRWRTSQTSPTVPGLRTLCAKLHVSADWLLGIEGEGPTS